VQERTLSSLRLSENSQLAVCSGSHAGAHSGVLARVARELTHSLCTQTFQPLKIQLFRHEMLYLCRVCAGL
jgi:hypothetical protein